MVPQRNRRIHEVDSSVPLTRHDPKDLGLICLIKKSKIRFQILSDLKIQSWIFLKKSTLGINPRSFGSWHVKGTEESTSRVDSLVPWTPHDPKDLELISLLKKKRKIRF